VPAFGWLLGLRLTRAIPIGRFALRTDLRIAARVAGFARHPLVAAPMAAIAPDLDLRHGQIA